MSNTNQKIVDRYFEAYAKDDMAGIRNVMAENVKWYFEGDHPLAGEKNGIEEVVAFFDVMTGIMQKSNYFIECQHSRTNRDDGDNLDHYTSVLWTIENGKIVEGRHFFANPAAVNKYFTGVAPKK